MTRVDEVPMPPRIARLPRNSAGYPIPWFVAEIEGVRDFRVMDARCLARALEEGRCWVCGEKMNGPTASFVIGPMCAVNRTSAEPPSHRECAVYSARVCPFLTNPQKVRREANMPEGAVDPAGISIKRNPGVALVWASRHWRTYQDGDRGVLFDIGPPTRVLWFAEGREATRQEVMASIETGLPALSDMAADEGPEAEEHLALLVDRAMALVPA